MLTNTQQRFIVVMRSNAEALAQAVAQAGEVVAVFVDRDYDDVSTVTDEDLAEFDLNRADVAAYIAACQQLINWRDNLVVTQGDYGEAINKVRSL